MRNYSRFIPGEEIGAVEQWDFGAVDTASLLLAAQVAKREEATDQAKHEVARQEGYAEGFVQGRAQATLEAQRQIADYMANQAHDAAKNFAAIFESATSQLADVEQVIARGTLELACELARQVLRHELSINPNALQPVIREVLGLLVAETKTAVVKLNPLDLEVLEDVLRAEFSSFSSTLLADATITRGGCVVESAGTVIDGTLETRWKRALASLGLSLAWERPEDE